MPVYFYTDAGLLSGYAISVIILSSVWYYKSNEPIDTNNTDINNGFLWHELPVWADVSTDASHFLDPDIPTNYIPVPGMEETYMVLNEDGTVNCYRQRSKDGSGNWVWSVVIADDMPVSLRTSVIDDDIFSFIGSRGDGEFYRYVRNGDDSYAFVPVDETGADVGYIAPQGDSLPENFVLVQDNIYASLDNHGVIIKLWERNINDLGAVYWQEIHRPYQIAGSGITDPYSDWDYNHFSPDTTPITTSGPVTTGKAELPGGIELLEGQTYTTESFIESKTTGGWKVTYETVYTNIYNADGSLYATHKDGPNEIERIQVFEQQTDLSRDAASIETNIQAEVIRVSNGLDYKRDIASSVLEGLNAYRAESGLSPLTMTYDSDAGRLSTIFAADMAKYNYGDIESPLYGTVEELAKRYGINNAVSINVWRCGEKSSEEINTRLQTAESSRNVRMDAGKTNVGISIVARNGFFYIAEVFTD